MISKKKVLLTLPKGDWCIYDDGRIYSRKQKKFIKPKSTKGGNLYIRINGKRHFVRRLVAELYVWEVDEKHRSNRSGYTAVIHIDGNTKNLRTDNLKWTTLERKYDI